MEGKIFPQIQLPIEICVLLYGNYPELAERCLESLRQHTSANLFNLSVGLNAISPYTREIVERFAELLPSTNFIESKENVFKYPMMRRLFDQLSSSSKWVIWLDDDSYFTRSDWLLNFAHLIEINPEAKLVGSLYSLDIDTRRANKIRAAPWFRGIPLIENSDGSTHITFPTGGFWAMRADCLRELDWPDARLQHNGGDYLLGEAVRQQGWKIFNFDYGVAINEAHRRSSKDTPPPY